MRRIGFLIFMVICSCHTFGQEENRFTDAEKRVNNCALMLGMTINNLLNSQPIFDVRAFADTLYRDLYTRPAEVRAGTKYMGKICLQAFFSLSEDQRIDYPEIERCLAVTGKHEAFYTPPFIICAFYYAQWAERQQLTDKEITALQLGLKAHDKLYPDSTTVFSENMNLKLSSIYFQQKQWRSAAKYTERLLEDMRRLGEDGTDGYMEMLICLGSCYKFCGKNHQADSCYMVVQQDMVQKGNITSEEYIDLLIDRAEIQETLGRYEEAESLLQKAKNGLSPSDYLYHEVMLQLAQLYSEREEHEKVLSLLHQELACFEKEKRMSAKEFLSWIVFCNNPLATNEGQRFVNLLEKNQDGTIANMAVLAYAYSHAYQYEKAMQMADQVEKAYVLLPDEEKEELMDYLQPMFTSLNDFDRQIELCKMQVKSVEKIVGNQHNLYAEALALEAAVYSMKGDYQRCLQLLDSCKNVPNVETSTLFSVYDTMSEVYSVIGDYEKSTRYASVLLNHIDDITMQRKLMGRIIVNMISELEIRTIDIDERGLKGTDSLRQQLIHRANQLMDFCQRHFGDGHLNTIEAMEYLASAYYLADDTPKMLDIVKKCEQRIKESLTNKALRKTYLEGLAPYYRKSKDYQKALELVDTACLSRPNVMYAEIKATLEALSELNLDLQHYDTAQNYYKRLVNSIINETTSQMSVLTSKERQYYWRMSRHTLSNAGKYVRKSGEQTSFAGTIYNLALFSKSLLLSSDQAFVHAVRKTGSEELLMKMRQMMNLRSAIVQDARMSSEERAAKSKFADQLERELLSAIQKDGQSGLEKKHYDWMAIQQELGDSALAIEMVQYSKQDDSEYYGAVLLKKGWAAPVFVEIGKKGVLDSLQTHDLSSKAGQQVWLFSKPYLDDVQSIYFSPVGVFHSLPIEDMSFDEYGTMSKHFQMYRLSSTMQLLSANDNQGVNAVVFGGLEYGMPLEEKRADETLHRGAADFEQLPYLAGTAIEADSIAKIINGKGNAAMKAVMYSGKEGTENAFKALDGKNTMILHIGTHGFYAKNDEAIIPGLTHNFHFVGNLEDRALAQSGLYMTGAENILNQEMIPEGVDDGILTSQEVSTLDLRGLDMVTLSACQTALGKVTGDGVFGLQRGFKKAGAQSILMSLWKVDDEATCLLMTEFYRHWIVEKKTKHDALEAAKHEVRSHKEKGWDNPKFWAAFILLDGLDQSKHK